MESDETTILQLWKKKGGKQRRKLLAQHWPDMALRPRPDLQLFREREPTDDPLLSLPDPTVEAVTVAEATSSGAGDLPRQSELEAKTKRDALLYPHMNTEYLAGRWWYLAQMLQSRGRHSMDYFALQDMPPGRRDFLELFICFKDVPGHFMVTDDHFLLIEEKLYAVANTAVNTYGRLVHMENADVWVQALVDKRIMLAGQGLILLEIQERLYTFLADMAEAIFEDRPKSTPEPAPSIADDNRLISGAAASTQVVWVGDERDEAPYSGIKARYHTVDYLELRRRFSHIVVRAKLAEATGHWCLLRRDPGYFKGTVTQWKEHRVEMLATIGNHDSVLESVVWVNAIKDSITTAFEKMGYWDEALRRIEFLKDGALPPRTEAGEDPGPALGGVEDSTDPGRPKARLFLYSYLSQWEGSLLLLLRKLWTFSPRLRPYSRRIAGNTWEASEASEASEAPEAPGTSSLPQDNDEWEYDQESEYEQTGKDVNPSKKEGKLPSKGEESPLWENEHLPPNKRESWEYFEWLFNSLFDPKVRHVLGMQTILDEIDMLVSSSPQAMKSPPPEHWVLSDLVNSQLSDLATHSEIFDSEFKSERDSKYEMLKVSRKYYWMCILGESRFAYRWKGGRLTVKKRLSGDKVPVPVDVFNESKGPFTFEGSTGMWSLGNPTDGRFDYPIDKPVKTEADVGQLEAAKKALQTFWIAFEAEVRAENVKHHIGNVSVLRFFDKFEECSPETLQSYVKKRRPDSGEAGAEPEQGQSNDGPQTEVASNDKPKTAAPPDYDDDSPNGDRHTSLDIRMDVDKRALRVFKTMFEPATKEWNPTPVDWKDFVHALVQADFKVFCRYGGEWLAVPPDAFFQAAHIFRQPRHGEKLSVATLRQYGVRLNLAAKGTLAYSQFSERNAKETRDESYSGFWNGTAYHALLNARTVPTAPRHEWSPKA
jgi:hypothetical protein